MPMSVPISVLSMRGCVVGLLLGIGIGLLGCQQATTDNTHISDRSTQDADTSVAGASRSLKTAATAVQSISNHIATTLVSPDTIKVVHEIVMPNTVPITLTNYQAAYLESMQQGKRDRQLAREANDADTIFAGSMVAHHLGAVRMANIELKYGSDPEMRKLAQDIIVTDQNEILLLQGWLDHRSDETVPKEKISTQQLTDIRNEYAIGLDDMSNQMMLGIMSQNPDIAFAQALLPHHKGALAMAQVELRYGDDERMRHMADNIIDSQETEIQFIQQWLQKQLVAINSPLPAPANQ